MAERVRSVSPNGDQSVINDIEIKQSEINENGYNQTRRSTTNSRSIDPQLSYSNLHHKQQLPPSIRVTPDEDQNVINDIEMKRPEINESGYHPTKSRSTTMSRFGFDSQFPYAHPHHSPRHSTQRNGSRSSLSQSAANSPRAHSPRAHSPRAHSPRARVRVRRRPSSPRGHTQKQHERSVHPAKTMHQIILHILLLYCVAAVTYILLFSPSNTDCICSTQSITSTIDRINAPSLFNNGSTTLPPSQPTAQIYTSSPSNDPTNYPIYPPSKTPSNDPTNYPTYPPSNAPSNDPTNYPIYPPSSSPSNDPTNYPTYPPSSSPVDDPTTSFISTPPIVSSNDPTTTPQPIIDSVHQNFVGDFKISAQNGSHGHWLLCDGSYIDPYEYPQLFDIIGYSFGYQKSGTGNLFALPDATDRVVGINGYSNTMGQERGNEEMTLTESHLPTHSHKLVNNGWAYGYYDEVSRPTLAMAVNVASTLLVDENFQYQMRANTGTANTFTSGSAGNGNSFNIMQPTIFVGNLFIYF